MTNLLTPSFQSLLQKHDLHLRRKPLETLQINIGRKCNQACHHCHVEAGPKRPENMEERTLDRILEVLKRSGGIRTVDITGGAPELNPHFRKLVQDVRQLGLGVIDRCNLTVLFEEGQEDTARFLQANQVKVIASLPCYSKENVEAQRGNGVFQKSIEALKILNALGYGKPGSALELDLVYNPLGAFLPPDQRELENDYRQELRALFGIEFNHLYTITNMPIKRFLQDLNRQGKLQEYMELLVNAFNPEAAEGVMCRSLVSIDWQGFLFDCDFNQMLELPTRLGDHSKPSIWDIHSFDEVINSSIQFGSHCFACTAGSGSSCTGVLVNES